jgi:hypothetical protein
MTRSKQLQWTAIGAAAAVVSALASFFLPAELGGYNPWVDPHDAVHNIAAIIVRFAVLGALGGIVGFFAGRAVHRRRH